MKREEFARLLKQFTQRPMPAPNRRHIYVWHGDPSSLQALLPAGHSRVLNLHHVVTELSRTPRARDEASRLLRRAIESYLYEEPLSGDQQVLIVTGCDLLNRYQVSLTPFFEFVSESQMVVFVVPSSETNFTPVTPLPRYVMMKSDGHLEYLRGHMVDSGAIVDGDE